MEATITLWRVRPSPLKANTLVASGIESDVFNNKHYGEGHPYHQASRCLSVAVVSRPSGRCYEGGMLPLLEPQMHLDNPERWTGHGKVTCSTAENARKRQIVSD